MKIEFSDGVKFNLQGKYRIENRRDGLYVVGKGMLLPVDTQEEGSEIIKKLEAAEK